MHDLRFRITVIKKTILRLDLSYLYSDTHLSIKLTGLFDSDIGKHAHNSSIIKTTHCQYICTVGTHTVTLRTVSNTAEDIRARRRLLGGLAVNCAPVVREWLRRTLLFLWIAACGNMHNCFS